MEVGCGGGEGVDAKEPTELGFDPIWLGKGTKEGWDLNWSDDKFACCCWWCWMFLAITAAAASWWLTLFALLNEDMKVSNAKNCHV